MKLGNLEGGHEHLAELETLREGRLASVEAVIARATSMPAPTGER